MGFFWVAGRVFGKRSGKRAIEDGASYGCYELVVGGGSEINESVWCCWMLITCQG